MRVRRVAADVCVVLSALALALAALTFYAERVLFDADRFADRVELSLAEPVVAHEIGGTLTDQIVAAEPDLIAVEPLVRGVAEQVVRSTPFRSLAGTAARQAHEAVFEQDRDSAVLIVSNGALLVTQALAAADPAAAEQVPAGLTTTLTSLSEGAAGEALVDLAQAAERVRVLGVVALALALLLLVGAVASTPRPERGRTVAHAGYAITAAGGLAIVVVELGRALLPRLADTTERAEALAAVWAVFMDDLAVWGFALAVAGLVVAASATSRATEPVLTRRLAVLARRLGARPQATWLRVLRALALIALGALIALEPLDALQWAGIAVGLLTIAVGLDELMTLTDRRAGGPAADAAPPRIGVRPYAALVTAVVVAVAVLTAGGVTIATTDAPPELGCNGSESLCDERLDAVAIPATHNSMSAPRDGFLFPNQESGIAAQLRGGVRGLLIDMHVGVSTPKGVYTVLEEGGKSRAKIEDAIGTAATQTALRLRSQIGYTGGGDEQVYLCHGFCEIGAIEAVPALREVRDFLVASPGSVLAISIEDEVTPRQVADAFERSGLLDYVWTGPVKPAPTLGEMVERGQRVVVFGEEDTAGVSWYHDQFSYVRDTPYDLPSAAVLLSPEGCAIGRGTTDSPYLLINQFVAGEPPLPGPARTVNQRDAIVSHARECRDALAGLPGLIAVDFWETGDVVGAARELNDVD